MVPESPGVNCQWGRFLGARSATQADKHPAMSKARSDEAEASLINSLDTPLGNPRLLEIDI